MSATLSGMVRLLRARARTLHHANKRIIVSLRMPFEPS
jgi:hypothetical protein